ncbi:hypothetical protein Tco_1186698 [Tanacetum coccineum]
MSRCDRLDLCARCSAYTCFYGYIVYRIRSQSLKCVSSVLDTTGKGCRTGRRTGRGDGRTRRQYGDQGNGRFYGQCGQVGGQGSKVNDGVDEVPDFYTIITQQLHKLLPTILAQVGNQSSNQRNPRNKNGNAVNDKIQGDVRNVIVNNNQRGCTCKEFLACNPKEYDGKGGAIVYTHWIEKIDSVQDMSGCEEDQKVKYNAG